MADDDFWSISSIFVNHTGIDCGAELKVDGAAVNKTCFSTSTGLIFSIEASHLKTHNASLSLNSTGLFYTSSVILEASSTNVFASQRLNFTLTQGAATTPAPTTTTTKSPVTGTKEPPKPVVAPEALLHAYVQFVHFHVANHQTIEKNSSAVSVAILEGLALIGIIALFAYKKFVSTPTTNNASYEYNSNRNTVQMNDIPPPRDYLGRSTEPPPSTTTIPSRPPPTTATITTQPQLITVPVSNPPATLNPPSNQFADPFSSLDNW